jgi:hypothetical protein
MIYVRSIFVGLLCACVASFLIAEVISAYLFLVYHVGMGPIPMELTFLC